MDRTLNEEMTSGRRFRTASRTITETDLVTFVTLTGMNEPLFYDEAGSLDAGYAGRLVPGALVFSYAEGLVMQTGVIHGTGMAFLRADVSVQAPVFVGDVGCPNPQPIGDTRRFLLLSRSCPGQAIFPDVTRTGLLTL